METPKENIKSLNKEIARCIHQKFGVSRSPQADKLVTREVLISLSPRGKPVKFANKQDEVIYRRRQKSLLPNVKKALSYIFPSHLTDKAHYDDDTDELLGLLSPNDLSFSRKNHRLPFIAKRTHSSEASPENSRVSAERIQFYNYTGEAESVYLGTRAGISECKQLYDRCLQQAGLYSFLKDSKHRKKMLSRYK
jgi:hypothetical protein